MTATKPQPIDASGSTSADDPPELTEARLLAVVRHTLIRPGWTLLVLTLLAAGIEFAQYWPEVVPGAHATGEVVRNLSYALIGAVVFHWAVVEYPESRRRRSAYGYHELDLQFLTTTGLGLLNETRHVAKQLGLNDSVDAWSREDVQGICAAVWNAAPLGYKQSRHSILGIAIIGVSTALDGLARSSAFFDPEVAQVLAQFPSNTGLHQLQLLGIADPGQAERDSHIVWELLEGGRRVYSNLRRTAPFVDLKVEGANVLFPDGTMIYHDVADLFQQS